MIEFKHGAGRRLQEQNLKDALSEVKLLRARIAELEAALLNLIKHTLDCELELDKFHGLGNDAGAGMSSVLCEARAALEGGKE